MPNPNPPVPPRIEDIGLERYLNRTKAEHNGSDYAEFVKRITLKEPKAVIGRAFNVQAATIRSWLEIYEKETKTNAQSV
jgi:hypothetical protein